ncbi:MAG TPA: NAD(P)-binding protein [Vicinamibacteria bacterium]|nr:NAD(P)-binding protein [Vicinamibacteria bacterium]
MPTREARDLGLTRRIARRDFINGVAVGAAGVWVGLGSPLLAGQAAARSAVGDYPPALTGLRGQYPGSFEHAHDARDGAYATFPEAEETGEIYDLVVVGGGISGLSAAYLFRQALGPERRVLVLDNHDDFGGHAKRNEFRHEGRLFIGYGGTQSIETPFPYSFVAKALLRELGVEASRYPEFLDRDLYARFGLTRGVFFDRETWGEDRLVPGYRQRPWDEFFAAAPVSEAVRRDLVRIHEARQDFLPGLAAEEKARRLARMSYQDYLVRVAGLTPAALPFFAGMGFRNNMRMDTAPALNAAQYRAPGFAGLGLAPEIDWDEESYTFHFPDGGATIARLLVNRLVPRAIPGRHDMETMTLAPLDYARLDERDAPVRLRLRSTVVRVLHDGTPDEAGTVRVAYVRDGRVYQASARNVILACFNSVVRFLMPELPEAQKQALAYAVKVPMMYSNVFVRSWRAFEKLGVSSVSAPGMYHTSLSLDFPVSIGGYRCSQRPDEPVVIHLVRNPNRPGLPRRDQQRAGMQELLATSFETIELETRRELARVLGPGGFDPAEDVLALTANRWPHGYAYTYDSLGDPDLPDDQRPHVIGRRRFGRVAIANSDAGAAAFINVAIDQAHRAVQELLERHGLK